MVLDGSRDNVPFASRLAMRFESKNGQIVAFRGAAGKDHLAARGVDDGGYLLTGLFDGGAGAAAILVRADAGVAEGGFEMAQEDFADARIERRRRGAVEINGSIALFHQTRMLLSLMRAAAERIAGHSIASVRGLESPDGIPRGGIHCPF